MASETEIINWAITKVGSERVLSINDNTPSAQTMKALYARVRDAEIRRYRWRFAIKREELSADATAPAWGYRYAYTLPTDYLGLVQAGEFYVRSFSSDRGPWAIEGRKLLTDLAPQLRIRYIQRITDPTLFDPLFVEALACKLAAESNPSLKQNEQKLQGLKQSYADALGDAMRADAMECPPDELPWGSWLQSREGSFGSVGAAGENPYGSGFTVL
jgi:hypothetical protein